MPALRTTRRNYQRSKKVKSRILKYLFLFFFLVFFIGLIFLFGKVFGEGFEKTILVVKGADGGADVVIFDPETEELIRILIPAETQVEVARSLGVWRLRSLWELGRYEGVNGALVAKTITGFFNFPVYYWAESSHKILDLNPINIFKVVFFSKTNLSLKDKIKLTLFSLGVKNVKRIDIDLSQTPYLKKEVLIDGEEGYILTQAPKDIFVFFAEPVFAKRGLRIMLVDSTGTFQVSEKISKILEVMGGKVVLLTKEEPKELNCVVGGKDERILKKLVLLFSCDVEDQPPPENFDLKLIVGKEFLKNN